MRVVIDTNILISALLNQASPPAELIHLWREGRFDLLTASQQIDELARVTRYPKFRKSLPPALTGRLVNELRDVAILIDTLPFTERSPDPWDNYLLAIAEAGKADYLVTGDKTGLLALGDHHGTSILTARDFCELQR